MWLNLQQHETIFEPSIKNKNFFFPFLWIQEEKMSSKSQGVGGAKVPSVLLTLTGIAIVAIQVQKFI